MDKRTYARGRGPKIPNDVNIIIAEICEKAKDSDPGITAKEIMDKVHVELRHRGMQRLPGWPGLSAIQKKLTEMRRKDAERPPESKEMDRPWSMGALVKYDIPPEALPKVFQVQEHFKALSKKPLTIRQAMWIGRLHALVTDITELSMLVVRYANRERIFEITDIAKDTSDIDNSFRSHMIASDAFAELVSETCFIADEIGDRAFDFLKELAEEEIPEIERRLGLTLDPPDFTDDIGGIFYVLLLQTLIGGEWLIEDWCEGGDWTIEGSWSIEEGGAIGGEWSKLPKEKQKQIILGFRDIAARASSATGTYQERLDQMIHIIRDKVTQIDRGGTK